MTDQDNETAVIGVTMPTFKEKYIDKKTVTFYEINLTYRINKIDWTLEKRYSDFKTLHDSLDKLIPNLPSIPGTTLFKVKSVDALTKRRLELQKFLRQCIQRKDILASKPLQDFLLIQEKAPEVIGKTASLHLQYEKILRGVRDFIF